MFRGKIYRFQCPVMTSSCLAIVAPHLNERSRNFSVNLFAPSAMLNNILVAGDVTPLIRLLQMLRLLPLYSFAVQYLFLLH